MTLPAQIEAAAASADQIQQQISGQPQDTSTAPTEPVQDAVKPQEVDEVSKLQNKYNSLRGKYDAEVPRLNQTVRDMEAQINALREENDRLQEVAATQEPPVGLTEQDVDVYGQDMVDMVQRTARQVAGTSNVETARLRSEIEQLKAQMNATKQASDASAEREFTRVFDEAIPNWRELNEDPEFLEWLKTPIPGYGVPRQIALNGAVAQMDAHQAVEIFKEFIQEKQAKRGNGLSRQIQPDYARRSVQPAGTVPQTWTQAKVSEFYERARRGEFTPEQYQRLENELNDALVRNNGQLPPY